jgi:hypothetical protein
MAKCVLYITVNKKLGRFLCIETDYEYSHQRDNNCIHDFGRKLEEKGPLERPKCRWVDIILKCILENRVRRFVQDYYIWHRSQLFGLGMEFQRFPSVGMLL